MFDVTSGETRAVDRTPRQDDGDLWTAPGIPQVGSVVVERDRTDLAVTEPVSGEELWRTALERDGSTAVNVETHPGELATVVVQSFWDDGTVQVTVFDARTGELLAETDPGAWEVNLGQDGSALLGLDDERFFLVEGRD